MYFENTSVNGVVNMDTKKTVVEIIVLHYLDNVSNGEAGFSRGDIIKYVLSAYNNGKCPEMYGAIDEDFVSSVFETEVQDLVEFAPGLYRSMIDHHIMTGISGGHIGITA